MKRWSNKILKSAIGNGLVSVSGFLSSLAILNVLGTEAFAQSAYLLAMAQILAIFMSLRLEHYISTVKGNDSEFVRSTLIIFILTLIVYLILFYTTVGKEIGINAGENLIYIVTCSCLLACSNLIQNFIISKNEFTTLTELRFRFAVLQPAFQIAFGYFWSDTVNGILFGLTLSNFIFIPYVIRKIKIKYINVKEIKLTIVGAKKFMTISLAADLFSSFSGNILVIYLNGKLSPEMYLAVVVFQRFIAAPLGVISRVFLDVFKADLAGAEQANLYKLCHRFTIRMIFIALVILAILTIMISSLSALGIWKATVTQDLVFVVFVMLPVLVLRFSISSTSYVLYFLGRQEVDFFWQILNFSFIYMAMQFWHNPIIGYSAASTFLYLVYTMLIWRALR